MPVEMMNSEEFRRAFGPAATPVDVPVTEAEFTRQVIAFAKLHGWRTAHFRPGLTKKGRWVTAVQGDGKGFVDLIFVRRKVVVAELKIGKRKPTTEQYAWLGAFQSAGIPAFVWTPASWAEIERVLGEEE